MGGSRRAGGGAEAPASNGPREYVDGGGDGVSRAGDGALGVVVGWIGQGGEMMRQAW